MKLRIVSDLHLEFEQKMLSTMPNENKMVLILAGDIGLASTSLTYLSFIEDVSERFRDIIWVLGNHEYYHTDDFDGVPDAIRKQLGVEFHNVHVLDDQYIIIDDIVFIGSTLWTSFNNDPLLMQNAKYAMNDYRMIKFNDGKLLSPVYTSTLHHIGRTFIFDTCSQHSDKQCVVVSHHAPSDKSIDKKYAGEPLNSAFATELFEFIVDTDNIRLWVHGHTHNSCDYMIGNTRVICNPRGYYEENKTYDDQLIVEV